MGLARASRTAFGECPDATAKADARAFLVHLYGHLNDHLGQAACVRRVVTGDGAIPLAR
ncbi:MAG TPA: hypothetical protein VFQ51_20485 [Vicinamibacteria bacterium]|nr:hypothetical protein [Vicinamibacteria bacterium]